jgi:hypothetical protein
VTNPGDAPAVSDELLTLIYELLDAHADTVDLGTAAGTDWSAAAPWLGPGPPPRWNAHLDYLRALQRTGREMLARPAPSAIATSAKRSPR